MERILIEGLELFAHHGVHESERQHGQVFLLDLVLDADMRAACESDSLNDTVNYSRVIDCATAAFCAEKHRLIERAAQVTITAVMREFPQIARLKLRVHKPDAPVKHIVNDIIFEIEQNRESIIHE